MKPLISLALLATLSACSMTNTTFTRPYAPPAQAKPAMPEVAPGDTVRVARVLSVEQADRLRVDVADWPALFGADLPITLVGLHLPQQPGQCPQEAEAARRAIARVEALLAEARQIALSDLSRAQHFGLNARIWLDGQALEQTLLNEGLAQQARTNWCP